MNVKENWFLYDTVAVSAFNNTLSHPIPGWYSTFAALAASDSVSFFDSRNKSIGLAYNNQESRDQIPFALSAQSISIGFFAPAVSSQVGGAVSTYRGRVDNISAFWDNELPQHTSCIFRVNQDERLKMNCAMMNAGYGPVGGAMGQGDFSLSGGRCASVHASGMGMSHLNFRWEFASPIQIPRRATLSADVRFVEWARTVLGDLWGPGYMFMRDSDPGGTPEHPGVYLPTMFMIQCLITGPRQVQQRGEYHAS